MDRITIICLYRPHRKLPLVIMHRYWKLANISIIMYLQALKIFKGRCAHWCKATSMSETTLWSADMVVGKGAYLAGRPGYLPSFGSKVPAHPSLHSPCPPLVPTTGAHQPLFQTFHRSRQTANCPIEHFRKVIGCPQNVQRRKATICNIPFK